MLISFFGKIKLRFPEKKVYQMIIHTKAGYFSFFRKAGRKYVNSYFGEKRERLFDPLAGFYFQLKIDEKSAQAGQNFFSRKSPNHAILA